MIGSLFFASSALAAGYGDAGCGLGSMFIGDGPGFAQVFAVTTNGTSGSQSFGISSGTSNCDASTGLVLAGKEQEVFVAHNFDTLTREMAAGTGEALTTFSGLLGCPLDKEREFGTFTQKNYQAIFTSNTTNSIGMLNATKEKLSEDPALSLSCSH